MTTLSTPRCFRPRSRPSGTASVSNLTLSAGATLAFNWTERATVPVLAASGTKTVNGAVKVKVSAADGIESPQGGKHVLTSGGGFAGKTVTLNETDKPDWVKGVSVNGDGNIVLDVKSKGFMAIFR